MWINLEDEEFEIVCDVLKHCNLFGLHFLIKQRLAELSPVNPKHTKLGAIKAAQTYFSSNDVIIEEDCVPCKQKQQDSQVNN